MMCKVFVSAVVLLTVAENATVRDTVPATERPPADGRAVVAFTDVNLVPMDRERILTHQTVVVRGGRIAEIGDAATIRVPSSALRVDGQGRYLTPALVDMHVHLKSPHELPLFLVNGVTTVYNLNGRPAHVAWRDRIRRGELIGPTIYSCGPTIRLAERAEEARRIVEEQSKAGYDSIKIYVRISNEAYPVLVDTARRHNMLVVGHIPRGPGLEGVLKAHQAIAHAEEYIYSFFHDNIDDESRIPEAASATRTADVPVILTLVAYDHILRQAEDLPAFLKRPEIQYLAPWTRQTWGPGVNDYRLRFGTAEKQEYLRKSLAFQKVLIKALHKAGVHILVGTDSMNPGVVPGYSVHEELHNLVELGFTPFEAIQAATIYPAQFFKDPPEFGAVAVGKRADLLLVDGDPLRDVTVLARPLGVMAAGRWLTSDQLSAMRNGVAAAYARDEAFVKSNFERDPDRVFRYLEQNDPFGELSTRLAFDVIAERGVARFVQLYEELSKTRPGAGMLDEMAIDQLGYLLLQADKKKEAIEVFGLNVTAHPRSATAYDSLASGHVRNGDNDSAIRCYRKSLEVNPFSKMTAEKLRKLTSLKTETD
jgi:hypothetical protein